MALSTSYAVAHGQTGSWSYLFSDCSYRANHRKRGFDMEFWGRIVGLRITGKGNEENASSAENLASTNTQAMTTYVNRLLNGI